MKISNHLFLYLRSRRSKNVGFRCFVCTKIPHHFFPLFACLAGELKQNKTTNMTEMWQSLILFHHRGCKNWDCCILKNIKILRMKVSMMELWCYSSHWKCCLSMVMLGDTSTIFHFGHVKEGSRWPEFSKSRIRNERRRKQEQLSPRQLNLHGKHPGGRRKGMELFFFFPAWRHIAMISFLPNFSLEFPALSLFWPAGDNLDLVQQKSQYFQHNPHWAVFRVKPGRVCSSALEMQFATEMLNIVSVKQLKMGV